ncbi:MAG: hypothetical protein H7Z17_06380 [Fuerstia sp.]|nr:hypothetical protein [Fuerstiella sp.]
MLRPPAEHGNRTNSWWRLPFAAMSLEDSGRATRPGATRPRATAVSAVEVVAALQNRRTADTAVAHGLFQLAR